jgi:hypothetical protein
MDIPESKSKERLAALRELKKKLAENQGPERAGYVTLSDKSFKELYPPPGTYDASRNSWKSDNRTGSGAADRG